ncbi:berberine bridge enzyme-like 22 [Andrographis paniculata]|uniref:berberine bridge enzyme-like 22 n=1 Tax=Andrographis paniculata TaxID=175694 RepID=UPI0021E75CF4|nr:berberine bridge enzyme-like 22 [Andrographis paniculata]
MANFFRGRGNPYIYPLESPYVCRRRRDYYASKRLTPPLCAAGGNYENRFVECMTASTSTPFGGDGGSLLHSPGSPSYAYLLRSAQQNPRWLNRSSSRNSRPPLLIITPYTSGEVRAAILCCRRHDLQVRVKSGGHDYEGLSYRCTPRCVIIDLLNLRAISIRLEDDGGRGTAWVQSGATLGELYYSIAQESRAHGFPAGLCPSVGVGGHFSGGGFGTLLRKHGLAADNVLDARLVDAEGNVLDRSTMGEDLFWAIRGGGGGSFGIVLAWKIKLVRLPPVLTVFTLRKSLRRGGGEEEECIRLINKWQHLLLSSSSSSSADYNNNKTTTTMPEDLFMRVVMQRFNYKEEEALFNALFLGPAGELIPVMERIFPELGLRQEDCAEMSWIESVLYFAGFQRGAPLEVLLNRTVQYKSYFKAKSDFVERPIPEDALRGIRERLRRRRERAMTAALVVIMDPFGGRMDRIPAWELPFPHRRGSLFNVQYLVKWTDEDEDDEQEQQRRHVRWIRELYRYMKPYVSSSPRAAYVNYRDLDLGGNSKNNNTEEVGKKIGWGRKYFKGNFKRLTAVKQRADPGNFFRNEQSIPPGP